jgi:hypothetical protein
MIYSKLQGRLGNQMFQYATIRTIAESKGYKFCYQEPSLTFLNSIKEITRSILGKPNRYNFCNISEYFDLSDKFSVINRFNQLAWNLGDSKNKTNYIEKDHINQVADISNIQDWTEVDGYFQSQEYFLANRDNIIKWFTPRSKYLKRLDFLENSLIGINRQVCCVHIRRGDYKTIKYAGKEEGWALPVEYYNRAIAQVNNDVNLTIFITDDPQWVDTHFSWVKPRFITKEETAVVDMFLMTKCRYNIIANSTFSWWGAWLNEKPDKVVIAPKYFLGWAERKWSPIGIKVSNWQYINLFS